MTGSKKRPPKLRTFGSCGKIVTKQNKIRVSCNEEYFKESSCENRISITATAEDEKALENPATANI